MNEQISPVYTWPTYHALHSRLTDWILDVPRPDADYVTEQMHRRVGFVGMMLAIHHHNTLRVVSWVADDLSGAWIGLAVRWPDEDNRWHTLFQLDSQHAGLTPEMVVEANELEFARQLDAMTAGAGE